MPASYLANLIAILISCSFNFLKFKMEDNCSHLPVTLDNSPPVKWIPKSASGRYLQFSKSSGPLADFGIHFSGGAHSELEQWATRMRMRM